MFVRMSATPDEKLNLLADNVIESIQRISSKHLTDEDRQKLLNAADQARRDLASQRVDSVCAHPGTERAD
jgi:hypothetical protein